ncbi:MAG: FAD-dependent thymidylate synthase [Candidatus Kerfeldbacteria bacterium]|nr:FAD-dependent thymidylate synthase [Candidatus Kerfeldbacteria bacterium]
MPKTKTPARQIYAVGGLALPPEATAYGLARYSRSDQPARQTFTAMAEKILQGNDAMKRFFEVFYFQYGHASIADLAHVAMAIENISMIAAMDVVDEQLWDGQERSTRYQHFSPEAVHTPVSVTRSKRLQQHYRTGINYLMSEYEKLYSDLLAAVREQNPLPKHYSESAYKSATRARAFDMARYLLPLGTLTSVGQITSGRTLEKMISRLLSSEYSEIRSVAADIKTACQTPAFNPFSNEITAALHDLGKKLKTNPAACRTIRRLQQVLQANQPLPTLIKYTAPMSYGITTKQQLRQVAKKLLKIKQIDSSTDVTAFAQQDPLVEAVSTAVYWVTHYSYAQIYGQVKRWSRKQLRAIFELTIKHRGTHDELLRALDTHSVTFDILMDAGSYRDMHRHRRTIQVAQDFTYQHGYDMHLELGKYGGQYPYQLAMDTITATLQKLERTNHEAAVYLMPMGFKRRALFKMSWNEIDYIGKLRTGGGRHLSYWKIALRMVEEAAKISPERAKHIPTTPLSADSVYER